MPDQIAYKIMTSTESEQLQRDGVFRGSPADIADGFIHLSCDSQIAETWDKHFAGVDGLVLAAVDLSRVGDTVRWEPSRGRQLFPHIYGALTMDAVIAIVPLQRTPDGAVKLPVQN
jgi:uncharacterized protein (DUF952 family)